MCEKLGILHCWPVIEGIDEAIDQIEDQVFDDPTPSLLERIFTLKRALLHLRRIIAPQHEVLNKLARGDYAVIDPERRIFFRDVYDHLVRLHDITESLRDLTGSALDTYLSVVSNRPVTLTGPCFVHAPRSVKGKPLQDCLIVFWRGEHVAEAAHGVDIMVSLRIQPESPADLANVDLDQLTSFDLSGLVSPH